MPSALAISLDFATLDAPGATGTYARGINGAGQIVGRFVGPHKRIHGFLRTAAGVFTTIDAAGAKCTNPTGINDAGQVVGSFDDRDGKTHGFLTGCQRIEGPR